MLKAQILIGTGTLLAGTMAVAREESPNVLIFIADDLGWEEVGAYGHPVVKTPHVDWLAAHGLRFDNFYLAASSSSPSRSAILSGMYPCCTEARNLHEDMPPYISLFTDRLHDHGYHTMLVGKSHGTNNPTLRARFDQVSLVDWSRPWEMADLWLEALKQRPREKPFFLFAASIDPHRPYKQGSYAHPYSPDDVVVPPYLQDSPEMREELADYYNEISRFDDHVGQVLEVLRKEGELDNTLIIVMSDNGRPFPQCKTRMNVQGLRSPFIVYYPAMVKGGGVTSSLASAVDIAPTILDIVGIRRSAALQGLSLLPVLKDPDRRVRTYAFAEHDWHVFRAYERAVVTEKFIYIRNWLPHLPNPAVGESMRMPAYKRMLADYQAGTLPPEMSDCFVCPRAAEELYAVPTDRHCMHDLSGDPTFGAALERLRLVLDVWQQSIGDLFPGEPMLKPDNADRLTGNPLKEKK